MKEKDCSDYCTCKKGECKKKPGIMEKKTGEIPLLNEVMFDYLTMSVYEYEEKNLEEDVK